VVANKTSSVPRGSGGEDGVSADSSSWVVAVAPPEAEVVDATKDRQYEILMY